jgi:dethiobiotin synthase
MPTWFITATGTDIGKTVLTTALCRALRAQGLMVRALKPVLSGYASDALTDSDSGRILVSLGVEPEQDSIAAITPWRFKAPLSPDMAAAREGRVIEFDALVEFCTAKDEDILLIEGVGGAMVPLTDRQTVLDWILALRAPALVVAGARRRCRRRGRQRVGGQSGSPCGNRANSAKVSGIHAGCHLAARGCADSGRRFDRAFDNIGDEDHARGPEPRRTEQRAGLRQTSGLQTGPRHCVETGLRDAERRGHCR